MKYSTGIHLMYFLKGRFLAHDSLPLECALIDDGSLVDLRFSSSAKFTPPQTYPFMFDFHPPTCPSIVLATTSPTQDSMRRSPRSKHLPGQRFSRQSSLSSGVPETPHGRESGPHGGAKPAGPGPGQASKYLDSQKYLWGTGGLANGFSEKACVRASMDEKAIVRGWKPSL